MKKRRKYGALAILCAGAMVLSVQGIAGVAAFASGEESASARANDYAVKNEKVDGDSFLIGSWVSYYPYEIASYEQQTANMAEAGLNFNIFPFLWSTGHAATAGKEVWDHIDEVYAENNMVYLMDDKDTYGTYNRKKAEQYVEWVQGLQNCIGYHVYDEPHPSVYDIVAEFSHTLNELDPERFALVNLLPAYAGQDYRAYIQGWLDAVGAEHTQYLSHDYYPFNASSTDTGIFRAMEVMRSVAYENGKLRTHAFPQSSLWTGKRMPTADEMRWNAYAYVAYGFKALTWFNLVTPGVDESGEGFKDSPIHRDGVIHDPALYEDFTEINWSIRGLGDALMNLDTVHAYHTRATVSGVEVLPDDWSIKPIGTDDLILSEMEAKDGGETHVMVFNKSYTNAVTAQFSIGEYSGITGLQWLNPVTGEYETVDTSSRSFSVSLRAGEGKLYKVLGTFGGEAADAPQADLPSGRYYNTVRVSLAPPEGQENAEIYYTLDGTYPSLSSPRYTSPLGLGENTDVNKFTLRAAALVNGRLSEILTREYFIIKQFEYDKKLYLQGESAFTAEGGAWEKSGGRISSSGSGSGAYVYTGERYDCFVAEAQLHTFGLGHGKAGLTIRSGSGANADILNVGVSDTGVAEIAFNGAAHPVTFAVPDFNRTSFDVKIIKLYDNIVVFVNGEEALSTYLSAADFGEAYIGVFTEAGIPFAADSLRVHPIQNDRVTVLQNATSVEELPAVPVDLYTKKADVLKLLPATVTVYASGNVSDTATVRWYSDSYDRTQSGDQTFFGTLEFAEGSPVVNTNNVRAVVTVKVRYDLIFWEIEDLVERVSLLTPSDYTPKSWNALKTAYDSALELMEERDQPQSVVYPLKRYLESGLAGLENPSLKWFAFDDALGECTSLVPSDYTADSFALFAAELEKVRSLPKTGPIAQADVDERVARLETARSYLEKVGKPYALQQLVTTAKNREAGLYTASSYRKLATALRDAETLILTGGTEYEFDAAQTAVRDALRSLVSGADKSLNGKSDGKTGAIVGGVLGGVAGAALVCAVVAILLKRRKKSVKENGGEATK